MWVKGAFCFTFPKASDDDPASSARNLACVYLEGRQDHKPVPVLHIVQAYGAFKVKAKVTQCALITISRTLPFALFATSRVG